MRWNNDNIVPFRFGGDNSRAGQQEIRYGPRPQSEREYRKQREAGNFYERLYFLRNCVEKFNQATTAQKKQKTINNLLEKHSPYFPKFKEIIPCDDAFLRYFVFRKNRTPPNLILKSSEGQLIIQRLICEQSYEYITLEVFPLMKICLELHGYNEKDWQKSNLRVHAIIPDDDRAPTWRQAFLGY